MTKDEALKMCLEYIETYAQGSKFAILIKEALAQPEPVKLWLWKNFVDGRPEYWAFDNAFPINMNDGDPQTLGEPCGYAWLKPSRQGRFDVSDEEVLSAVQNAKEYPPQRKPLTEDEILSISADCASSHQHMDIHFARAIEAKLRSKYESKN